MRPLDSFLGNHRQHVPAIGSREGQIIHHLRPSADTLAQGVLVDQLDGVPAKSRSMAHDDRGRADCPEDEVRFFNASPRTDFTEAAAESRG